LSARNGCTEKPYGRFCSSVNPNCALSHGQYVVFAAARDRDRLAAQLLDLADGRVRDDHGRVLLERRGDRDDRHVLLDGRERLQPVGHRDVDLSRGEQLQAVDLRPAHPDRDVEVVLPVDAFRDRLVEAAVLGLREPVGGEHDAVGRLRMRGEGRREHGGDGGEEAKRAGHRAVSGVAVSGDDATADIRSENGQSRGGGPRKMHA
jgi:hypothetical protein